MFGSTTTPAGGVFGNSQNQTQQPSLFGASANTQQNNNAGGGFGGFGQSQQNNNAGGAFGGGFGQSQQFSQQQQQQNNMNASVMGGLVRAAPSLDPSRVQQLQQQQQALPKLRQSVADKFTNTYIDGTSTYSTASQRALLTSCRGEVCS